MKLNEPLSPQYRFPKNFVWGVATSSYQIEGSTGVEGAGESIWDEFCRRPGVIADGSNGSVACDHLNRLEEDLDLIAGLGVDAYRFSISWPRVRPGGSGSWNEKGLAFYERLVDGLLARGIQPYATLNHWDLPLELQATGGWANRDIVDRFVEYALGIHQRLGDRLAAITTHNEPWVVAELGHETGVFAPGLKCRATAMQVSHHLLLSHGQALRALRAAGCKARLGIVLNLSPVQPATDSEADRQAASLHDGRLLRWYMDPLFKGKYPQDVLDFLGADAPRVREGDMAEITQTMDFLGINYYSRNVISAQGPWDSKNGGLPITEMGWEVYPKGLTELLLRLHADYPLPATYVMENGGAFNDELRDGRVHDANRTAYLDAHIAALGEAVKQGVPMAGYMVWSLMDNFEWASGYPKRFGIVYVDYATLQRTPKDSYLWFRDHLQRQRQLLPIPAQAQEPAVA